MEFGNYILKLRSDLIQAETKAKVAVNSDEKSENAKSFYEAQLERRQYVECIFAGMLQACDIGDIDNVSFETILRDAKELGVSEFKYDEKMSDGSKDHINSLTAEIKKKFDALFPS